MLNYSDQAKELDFSRVAQIKGQNLRVLFSSAERLFTTKPPRGLAINPFEVFIALVQAAQ